MRHRPSALITRCMGSAQSGQRKTASEPPLNHVVRHQWRRATSTSTASKQPPHSVPAQRANAPRNGSNQSHTSTKILEPVHQQHDDHTCLIRIKPQPTSTFYTTAILAYLLKEFGSVLEFRRLDAPNSPPPAFPAGKLYRLRFDHESSRRKALKSSPLTLDVDASGHASKSSIGEQAGSANTMNSPAGASIAASVTGRPTIDTDPYNVLGQKGRHLPRPSTFTCTIQPAPTSRQALSYPTGKSTRPALLRHEATQAQYESLKASGAPGTLAWVLALRPGEVSVGDEAGGGMQKDDSFRQRKREGPGDGRDRQ
jgi:hypothetical protein